MSLTDPPSGPAAVVTVRNVEDVAAAVKWAVQNQLTVSTQPPGHSGRKTIDGTVLIHTGELCEISIDPRRRTARVGAGVKWAEFGPQAEAYGLAGVVSTRDDSTVVGFSLNGGVSWFGRAHGLASHNVRAVELVSADGEIHWVTPASEPDLFWAICGGGDDFGIVTAMEIALFPAPHIYGGRMMWPIEMAFPVLHAFRQITSTAPDELTMSAQLLRFPPFPDVPEPLCGGALISIETAYLGSAGDAEQLLAPLREIPTLLLDTIDTVPLSKLGGISNMSVDPMPVSDCSTLLRDLDIATIEALLKVAGSGHDVPLVFVQLRHLGGAFTRATECDGPLGAIDERYQLFASGVPITPQMGEAIIVARAALTEAVSAQATDRTIASFNDRLPDPTRSFSTAALNRLHEVKRTVDPSGTIRGLS